MELIDNIENVRENIYEWKRKGESIGFVPTMGFLHEGHESLIKRAKKENDHVVVSIFVNPKQFGANEDLDTYPKDLERDMEICERAGASFIFCPEPLEMYPSGFYSFVDIDALSSNLCGKSRPSHFRGVCTVVAKLFNIVTPDRAYFGKKDAQQLAIIKQMALDLNIDVEIVGCKIVREKDGLAKSSRNSYLSTEEREAATILSKSLRAGKDLLNGGERDSKLIIDIITNNINSEPLAKIDYVSVVDMNNLEDVKETVESSVLVAIAVFIGKTRLIDNFYFYV